MADFAKLILTGETVRLAVCLIWIDVLEVYHSMHFIGRLAVKIHVFVFWKIANAEQTFLTVSRPDFLKAFEEKRSL